MEHYVGLDVSLKLTAICIVDRTGKIVREGVVTSDPETIAAFIKSHAPHVARVGLEAGATSTWQWTELNKMGAACHLHRCQACEVREVMNRCVATAEWSRSGKQTENRSEKSMMQRMAKRDIIKTCYVV